MSTTKEPGGWYRDEENTYTMIDPITGGTWLVYSEREESEDSLNSLVDFNLMSGGLTRPQIGTVSGLKRLV